MTAERPLVKRHHGIVRLAHWLNAIVLVGMIASGLQIYMAFRHFGPRGEPYPNPFDGQSLPGVVAARRLAGRRAQLALRAGLAVRDHRPRLPRIPGLVRRVALPALPAPRRGPGDPDAALLPPPPPPPTRRRASTTRSRRPPTPSSWCSGPCRCSPGFAIYKPVQLAWLTALFGGYELARYWHFWTVWIFVGFTLLHVALVFLVDPASLRAHDHGLVPREVSEP